MESLDPERGRETGLKEKGTDHVSDSSNHALDTIVLLGCVWAGEAMLVLD